MGRRKIMIVEDERIIAEDIKRTLNNFGYDVTSLISSGKNAVLQARQEKPDLVLMDIMLEGTMTGIEAAALIRKEIGAPVIYLTAYANEKILQSAKVTEPFGYIIKPFEERELHATIEMAFYRHKIEKTVQRKTLQQEKLLESARHLTSSIDLKLVLTQIGRGAKEIMKAYSCAIYLLTADKKLKPVVAIDPEFEKEILEMELDIDKSLTGMAVKEKRTLIFNDASESNLGIHIPGTSDIADERIIVSPFVVDNEVLGAMCLSRLGVFFSDEDLTLAEAFATYAATALKNAQTHRSLQNEIEERKAAEKKLQETQFRLATIFTNVPNIVMYEKFGGRDFISDNIQNLLGITPEQYISGEIKIEDLLHPEDKELVLNKFREWCDSGKKGLLSLWYRARKIGGNYVWIEDRMFPVSTPKGEKYISGVMIDTTMLKEAEEALRQSQLMYKTVVQDQSELIFRYLTDGTLTFVNNAYCRFYNKDYHDIIGKKWFDFLSSDESERIRSQLSAINKKNPTITYENEENRAQDGIKWVEWTFRALFDATDKIIEYQAVGRDITEKKMAEIEKENIRQQLLHSQKMEVVGRLAGGIAHDFNNLLTAIIGYAELISKKLTPANPLQNDLETIIACGNKASNLTKQFLAFSRKQIVEPKVLNINMIINDMYAMLHHIIGEDIDFINNPGTALQNTRIDKTQLEQVITNLVLNARDAISSGGRIIISTGNIRLDKIIEAVNKQIEPGEYVTLTVKDNGTGISPEIRSHLFEPFYTTKEQGKGSGLGLATVFDIVNQHNGYITVISELNKGSEFTLYFHPTAEKAEISYATTTEKELPGGHETILVAEDEPNIREFVCDILDEFGYKVIKAVNGQEALQKAAEFDQTIHLLVTDVVMPIMNGNELAEKLLPDFPRIKIIYMSGYTESSAIQKIVLETKSGFLQKPFSVSDLILKVRNILDN